MRTTVSALSLVLLGLGAATASAAGIRGDYVEARTADVFTGPCFSNAEVFIYGNRAVMAWKVTEGSWNGVDLQRAVRRRRRRRNDHVLGRPARKSRLGIDR